MATPSIHNPASMIPGILISTKIPDTNDLARYTVPANRAVKIAQGSLCNISAAPVFCGFSIVPSGGTVGDGTHKAVADTSLIQPGDTYPLSDVIKDHFLGDGDMITVHASVANAIDVLITGVVFA